MIKHAPLSEKLMSYDDALLYCSFLDHDGYRNWRMPTKKEWMNSDNIIGWCTDYVNDLGITVSVIKAGRRPVTPVRDVK